MKDERYKLHKKSERDGIKYYMGMKCEQENTVLSSLVQTFFHIIFICSLMTLIRNSDYTASNYQITVNNKLERMEKAALTV